MFTKIGCCIRKLRREDNPTGLILLAIEDITTRKHTEEELLRSHEDSQRFAYVAAHDLRAPLRSPMALLELLERAVHRNRWKPALANCYPWLESTSSVCSIDERIAYSQVGEAQGTMLVPLQNSFQLALTNLQNEIEASGAQVDWGALPSPGKQRERHEAHVFGGSSGTRTKRPLSLDLRLCQ